MTKIVGEVAIEVGADIGPLTREMSRGANAVSSFGARTQALGRNMQAFGSRVTAIGKTMSIYTAGIAAATAAAFKLAESTAATGNEIAKSARQAGVSGEYFQEMAFAIGQVTNVTQDQLTTALTMLNRKLGEAQNGSASAIRAFERIGIAAEDIANGTVNTEKAFDAFVQTMEATTDPAIAAAVSTALLGRSGAALGSQLAGAEGAVGGLRERARELGIVMSGDALDASEQFNDKMDELRRGMEALRLQVGAKLLPVFVKVLIPAMVDKVIPAIGSVVDKIGQAVDWFGQLPAPVQEAAGVIATAFAVGGPVLVALGATMSFIGAAVAATGPIGLLLGAAALLTAAWVMWGDDIKAAVGGAIEYLSGKFQALLKFLQSIIDKAKEITSAVSAALNHGARMGTSEPGMPNYDPANMVNDAIGRNMATGIIGGFGAGLSENEKQLREYLDRIPQIARDQLDIRSPSQVFYDIGANIGLGLAEGIASTQALVAEATASIGNTAVMSAGEFASSILGSMKTLFAGSKPIAAAQALINTYLGISEALKLPFPASLAAAAKVAAQGFAAVQGIRSASIGGGGGRARGGGGASAPAAAQPSTYVNVSLTGGNMFGGDQVRGLITAINKEIERGMVIKGIRAT
jgi:hypothetical protein